MEATIFLINYLNPEIGYQVRITRGREVILHTSVDPASGLHIRTFAHAVEVVSYYVDTPKGCK